MNLKLRLFTWKRILLQALSFFWYDILAKPIAYFLTTEKVNARYDRKRKKITEEQAIRWMAEDLARTLLRKKQRGKEIFLICDSAVEDDFWYGCTLFSLHYSFVHRKKTKMAFHKFTWTIERQEEILNTLKKLLPELQIKELHETFSWNRITNYKKTVHLSLR